ncbi:MULTISPECIES: hypothetical protein [unclassified Streptomyces]|uniref:hypothetical protein n=1 Tax=unclassified Streptomyces TaxID=2593676 RepID=UPI0012FEB78A|nr:hypothetical protein [Streptomyces sp. NBC_00370]
MTAVIDNTDRTREVLQGHQTAAPRSHRKGDGMANKIEIRPLDKKETTGDSGGNGGS